MLAIFNPSKIVLILSASFFTVNCGSSDGSKSNPDDKDGTSAASAQQLPVDTAKDSSVYSYSQLVDSIADLPKCDDAHERQLIYVVETSEFKACSKAQWNTVNLKGKDGTDGKIGTDGKNGAIGASGKDGKNGVDGQDGQTVNGNMWFDPVTKKYWLLPSAPTQSPIPNYCTNGWRMPTANEVSIAAMRGLKTAADAINAPKFSHFTSSAGGLNDGQVRDAGSVAYYGMYCIQE